MERIKRELRKLAFGKANDCVKLALCEDVDIASLDLSLLTEIRKSEKGSVEIKLMDRSKVLEQLAGMADQGHFVRSCVRLVLPTRYTRTQ